MFSHPHAMSKAKSHFLHSSSRSSSPSLIDRKQTQWIIPRTSTVTVRNGLDRSVSSEQSSHTSPCRTLAESRSNRLFRHHPGSSHVGVEEPACRKHALKIMELYEEMVTNVASHPKGDPAGLYAMQMQAWMVCEVFPWSDLGLGSKKSCPLVQQDRLTWMTRSWGTASPRPFGMPGKSPP